MKKEENLAATNQLIRFIRGGVNYEEFYDQHPEPEADKKGAIIAYGLPLLAGLLFMLTGYAILFWQLNTAQSQLDIISKNLEAALAKNFSSQDLETRQAFWKTQQALYKDLRGEKLSMSCILKELSHLDPADIFLKRISLRNATFQSGDGQTWGKVLILEGIKKDAYGDVGFSTFLGRLNQSSFFQKVCVNSQQEVDYNRSLNFVLTCDLK